MGVLELALLNGDELVQANDDQLEELTLIVLDRRQIELTIVDILAVVVELDTIILQELQQVRQVVKVLLLVGGGLLEQLVILGLRIRDQQPTQEVCHLTAREG